MNALAPVFIAQCAGQQGENDEHHHECAHNDLRVGNRVLLWKLVADVVLGKRLEAVNTHQVQEAAEDQAPIGAVAGHFKVEGIFPKAAPSDARAFFQGFHLLMRAKQGEGAKYDQKAHNCHH
ncbi:hypothetical protein SDC9_182007 [bioreactor metagenome]|uniref:Uncharacterized protein n=1 Tax=bioreactor metagenome TaxID=1076179 RepID=A0A645HFR6_9ZZZZ